MPASGTSTPTSAATHAIEPSVMNVSSICFDCGTRPKSRMLAQPSAMLAMRPATRPSAAIRPPRSAIVGWSRSEGTAPIHVRRYR